MVIFSVSTPARTHHRHPVRHHLYSSPPLPPFADYSVRHQPGPSEELLCSVLQSQRELKEMVKALSDRVGRLEDKSEGNSGQKKLPPELSECLLNV